VHIFLTPSGRALKRTLVPLAEAVNRIAVRGVASADIAATRRTLVTVLVNLARDELRSLQKRS
jgi:DNA-binding MarR family transcriptional regulator